MKQSKTNTILHILKTFLHRRLKKTKTKSLLSQPWMAKTEGSGCCEDNEIFKNEVSQMSHLGRGDQSPSLHSDQYRYLQWSLSYGKGSLLRVKRTDLWMAG